MPYISPPGSASSRIPSIAADRVSDKAREYLDILEKFVEEECIPADDIFKAELDAAPNRWDTHPPIIEEMKARAKSLGLWNMFLPKAHFPAISPGFSNLEYGLMAEYLGKSVIASESTNCAAPDTGNMEVLARYSNEKQQAQYLRPLLDGKIRSAFLMTEPDVASSDASNIDLQITREGNEWVLNGSKWWSSGAGDPNCKIFIVMGVTSPAASNKYKRHSVVLVPAGTKGLKIERMLSVIGFDDAPHGHGHITFDNVRVPVENIVLGEGRGFEIIQGRLGPGRIHHAMRSIGAAEKALEWMISRVNSPTKKTFGAQLSSHGVVIDWIARSRIEIDAARLVVLNAAIKMDLTSPKEALKEIAEAKILVPTMTLTVIDRAMQAFGGAGLSQDTPLAAAWANARTLRIVDGPDEVHVQQLGKTENKRHEVLTEKIQRQKQRAQKMFTERGYQVDKRFFGQGMLKSKI